MNVSAAALALFVGAALWQPAAPLPEPRTEVAAAVVGGEIAVAGGFTLDGGSSPHVDFYSPASNRWRRGPDLPVGLNHAMAATDGKRLYVVGGHGAPSGALVLENGRWQALPSLPEPRAAGGAAVIRGRLYVVGGVVAAGNLARTMLVLDLATRRWSTAPGPTPREHLAVTSYGSRIYALAGRTAGLNTNLTVFEVYDTTRRSWSALPPVPEARGGTAAAAIGGSIVSVGGEAPAGTIASVYAFDIPRNAWRRLEDLPTPRHGLGVVGFGRRVYVIGGGTKPGLTVSDANEFLQLR